MLAAVAVSSGCIAPSAAQEAAAGARQPPADARDRSDGSGGEVELAPVRVVAPRPPADPFAFRNPVEVGGTVFSRRWDESPSLEEVGMRGGYVQMAVNRGLGAVAKGVRRLPGWQDQVVAAEVRPPPLEHDHAERARRLYEGGADPSATTP